MEYFVALWLAHPIIFTYFPLLNLGTFIVYAVDKISAESNAWRVRERTLLVMALIGGSAGALLGMHVFRHKTKKMSFQFWLALILCLQIVLVFYLLQNPPRPPALDLTI
jgi:uncharacterized membrane protein YsdA (DUF1294 family)